MPASGLTDDRRNFHCVTVASVDLIPPVLRDILNSHIKPVDLYKQIKSCLKTLNLRKEQQAISLIPPPGVPDYNKFDVTLLYTLIRNLCHLPCPAQGWGNPKGPEATDTQISDDIERLRLFRNNYYAHRITTKISDNEFKDIWGNLTSAISRIQSRYNIDYKDEVIRIEHLKFTLSDWEECLKILDALADKPDIIIKGENEIIHGGTAQFEADVNNFESSSWSIRWQRRRGDIIKCIDTNMKKYSGSTKRKLVINSVCKEDEGEYQALLSFESNGPEYKSRNAICLYAVGEMPFINIMGVTSGSEELTIHFNCGVSEQSPKVHLIEWSKNDQQLDNDSNKYVGGGVDDCHLKIKSPTYEDRGNYICKVTNAVGSESKNIMLDVPSVKLFEVSPVRCGSETTIKSEVSSTPTPEKIEWQKSKDGVDFHPIKEANGSKHTKSSSCFPLVIQKATFADKLYYRLLVWNKIGKGVSNTMFLNITGSLPNIKIISETDVKNRSLKLIGNVIVYDDSPEMQEFFWSKNNKEIDFKECGGKLSEMRTGSPSLTITNVGPDDAGEYQLTAINAVGSYTSQAITLGAPKLSEENIAGEINGGQWITVTIKSIPEPFHVQWSAKRTEEDTFTPIDINDEEHKGTSVSLPHPVLFVRQKDHQENNCFRIEVTNFIGKTELDISGDETTKQRKIDCVESTIYNDDGEILKFTMLSSTIVKLFPNEKLETLKYLIKSSQRVKNTTSLEAAKSVLECIQILQDEQLFTQKDVIFMQFLCQETDCLELFRICKDFAVEQKALCYFKTELVNGYKEVEFHVQGDVSGYTKAYIRHVIKTVAVILRCKEEDIILHGVRHSKSFILSLSVKDVYFGKLLALKEKDRIMLRRLNIDYLIIDGENIHLESLRPKVSILGTENSVKDELWCHLCENKVLSFHCKICHLHLCKNCEKKHISGACTEQKEASFELQTSSTKCQHKAVPFELQKSSTKCQHKEVKFELQKSSTKCQKHPSKMWERYCFKCDIRVCVQCVSFLKHTNHKLDMVKFPNYQIRVPFVPQSLMVSGYKYYLNENKDEITRKTSDIEENIPEPKKLLDSNLSIDSAYKSRRDGIRRYPCELAASSVKPKFTFQKKVVEEINQQCNSLSRLSIKAEEHSCTTVFTDDDESSSTKRPLIDEPRILKDINTGLVFGLHSVSCLTEELIWTCSYKDNIIRLYNLHGEQVELIETKSGNKPGGITVTRNGNLVYTDYNDKSVNIGNEKTQTMIRLQGWRPCTVCCTLFNDILVTMTNNVNQQTKIVRYSGSTEKQTIQYDDKGTPLFSSGDYMKYISESSNLDICVSDRGAGAVVVVNQAGKLRFTYTGPSSTTDSSFSFDPFGITTDSQGRILVADCYNHCIHTLDQDGQFLRYIDNCDLHWPWGLCVDTRDNLFVTEFITGKVKKIQYCT